LRIVFKKYKSAFLKFIQFIQSGIHIIYSTAAVDVAITIAIAIDIPYIDIHSLRLEK